MPISRAAPLAASEPLGEGFSDEEQAADAAVVTTAAPLVSYRRHGNDWWDFALRHEAPVVPGLRRDRAWLSWWLALQGFCEGGPGARSERQGAAVAVLRVADQDRGLVTGQFHAVPAGVV